MYIQATSKLHNGPSLIDSALTGQLQDLVNIGLFTNSLLDEC